MNEKDLLQAARRMQYATEKIETLARAKGVYEDACAVSSDGHDRRLKCAGIQDGMASPLRCKGEWSSPKLWPPFNQGIWRKGL